MAKVTMPQLGESVAEGTIGKWLKKPGDHVAKYEPLLEVITDKVNAEVPSPVEGTLTEILVEEGATVPNNAEIAIIETAGEAERRRRRSSAGARPPRRRTGAGRPRERPDAGRPPAPAARVDHSPPPCQPARGPRSERARGDDQPPRSRRSTTAPCPATPTPG